MAVSFDKDIKPYFTACYKDHMLDYGLDLWSAADVKTQFSGIRSRVKSGSMPPDAADGCEGSWDDAKKNEFIKKFDDWKAGGYQP